MALWVAAGRALRGQELPVGAEGPCLEAARTRAVGFNEFADIFLRETETRAMILGDERN